MSEISISKLVFKLVDADSCSCYDEIKTFCLGCKIINGRKKDLISRGEPSIGHDSSMKIIFNSGINPGNFCFNATSCFAVSKQCGHVGAKKQTNLLPSATFGKY